MKLAKLFRSNILNLEPYTGARDENNNAEMILLDANESPFPSDINRYPDPVQAELKLILSKNTNLDTEQILIGNGSDEIIDLLIRSFCEPNEDKILVTPPTYKMYEVLANINAVGVEYCPLNKAFQLDLNSFAEIDSKNLKIYFLCSPNNPSGNLLSIADIEQILRKTNGIVCIDEAYVDFIEGVSWIDRLSEFPQLVVLRTFSKGKGMAGLRLGVLYASKEIIKILSKVKLPYNVNTISQKKAVKNLLNNDFKEQIETLKTEKTWLAEELNKLECVEKVFPSNANFLLVKFKNAKQAWLLLFEKGIVVRDRSMEHNCAGCLRISVGLESENRLLIAVLKEYN